MSRENGASTTFPRSHLSHSQVNKYLTCPEQYRLYYLEGLRPRVQSANLAFGSVIHRALEGLFSRGLDPVEIFETEWAQLRNTELRFSGRDSWTSLKDNGEALLALFFERHAERITAVERVEARFEAAFSGVDRHMVGFIDLVAALDGVKTVIDFKTSGATYRDHEAAMSDQLSMYQLVEPEAQQGALCVLVKTKKPAVIWQVAARNSQRLSNYVRKVRIAARGIGNSEFYRRAGIWCSWCDYLPLCSGDGALAHRMLVQIEPSEAGSRRTA